MKLLVDIGNSCLKAVVADGPRRMDTLRADGCGMETLGALLERHPFVDRAIVCSTRADGHRAGEYLRGRLHKVVVLDHTTPVPIRNLYATPDTLGPDRLAAAVGAWRLFPGRASAVFDFGTALTVDVVTAAGEFVGGNISAGLSLRCRALHEHTASLPLAEPGGDVPFLGTTTREALEAGALWGMLYEVEGYIDRLRDLYGDMAIIFTGGDAGFFEKRLKNTIFANYEPVFVGLDTILDYNADR